MILSVNCLRFIDIVIGIWFTAHFVSFAVLNADLKVAFWSSWAILGTHFKMLVPKNVQQYSEQNVVFCEWPPLRLHRCVCLIVNKIA